MSVDRISEKNVIDDARYEVIQRSDDQGLAVIHFTRGGYELWERVEDYRGEVIIIDGDEYRFLRNWKGTNSTS